MSERVKANIRLALTIAQISITVLLLTLFGLSLIRQYFTDHLEAMMRNIYPERSIENLPQYTALFQSVTGVIYNYIAMIGVVLTFILILLQQIASTRAEKRSENTYTADRIGREKAEFLKMIDMIDLRINSIRYRDLIGFAAFENFGLYISAFASRIRESKTPEEELNSVYHEMLLFEQLYQIIGLMRMQMHQATHYDATAYLFVKNFYRIINNPVQQYIPVIKDVLELCPDEFVKNPVVRQKIKYAKELIGLYNVDRSDFLNLNRNSD